MSIEDDAPLFEDFSEMDAVRWLEMSEEMLEDNEYGLGSAMLEAASSKYSPEETLQAIRAVIENDVNDFVGDMDDTLAAKSDDDELRRAILHYFRKVYENLIEQLQP